MNSLILTTFDKRPSIMVMPGEVVSYSRKSTKEEGAKKSIEDQNEVNKETAEEYGLPLLSECIFSEAEGMSGCLWYEGGGASGVEGDTRVKQKTRPVLTQIIQGVVSGRYKVIIVYSLDRLWRDVGICAAIIEVVNQYGCLLYDQNGPIDTVTPDGYNAVIAQSAAAAHQRRSAQVASPRGVRKTRAKGLRVSSASGLGFRNSTGKYGVIHILEEQEVVNRIYRLFDSGDGRVDAEGNSIGPLSSDKIAQLLMNEGYLWLPELWDKRAIKRAGDSEKSIYSCTIRHVLQDCRYQGRQPSQNQEWPCPAFLKPDGDPVVATALYERVQAKLNALKRGGNATRNAHPLSGLIRCGVCGQAMRSASAEHSIYGKRIHVPAWSPMRKASWCWCTHKLPTIEHSEMDNYINDVLAPYLLAEVHARAIQGPQATLENQKAEIGRALKLEEHRYCVVLPSYMGTVPPSVLGEQYKQSAATIARLKTELIQAEKQIIDFGVVEASINDIASVNPEMRRDGIRSVIRWVAVMQKSPTYITKRILNDHMGLIVFLTAWGTLHTALLYRGRKEGQVQRICLMRSAEPEHFIGSLGDFPDPDAFVAGLMRSYNGRQYKYAPREVAPGYYDMTIPIAAFVDDTLLEN